MEQYGFFSGLMLIIINQENDERYLETIYIYIWQSSVLLFSPTDSFRYRNFLNIKEQHWLLIGKF